MKKRTIRKGGKMQIYTNIGVQDPHTTILKPNISTTKSYYDYMNKCENKPILNNFNDTPILNKDDIFNIGVSKKIMIHSLIDIKKLLILLQRI